MVCSEDANSITLFCVGDVVLMSIARRRPVHPVGFIPEKVIKSRDWFCPTEMDAKGVGVMIEFSESMIPQSTNVAGEPPKS